MSYSEYGGNGYRNGVHIVNASDAIITPELENLGEPGYNAAYGNAARTMGRDEFDAACAQAVKGHVVLGDGPILVALHKSNTITIHIQENGAFREVEPVDIADDLPEDAISEYNSGLRTIDTQYVKDKALLVRMTLEGHSIIWSINARPNFQQVQVTQPNGTVWSGFSGYEIGAGHDEEDTAEYAERHQAFVRSLQD